MSGLGRNDDGNRPRYPLKQSFVVQIASDVEGPAAILTGRVEHLSSGMAVEFEDSEALLRFIDRFIAQRKYEQAREG